MAVIISDPTSIRDWLEAAVKRTDMYKSVGYDDLQAMQCAVLELEDVFDKMYLKVSRGS